MSKNVRNRIAETYECGMNHLKSSSTKTTSDTDSESDQKSTIFIGM